MSNNAYNPETVIQEAQEKVSGDKNDLAGAQMVFQTALLEWVDDASFGASSEDPDTVKRISEGVARLWVEFADLNRKANMFKAATDTFEAAVNCPIAGSMGEVWGAYAKFQQERNRNKTAQKIYLRALIGDSNSDSRLRSGSVTKVEEQDVLWQDFLSMMKRLNNDDTLTIEQLQNAVSSEAPSNANTDASFNTGTQVKVEHEPVIMSEGGTEQLAKRARIDSNDASYYNTEPLPPAHVPALGFVPIPGPIVSASTVELTALELLGRTKDIPAEITAEWLAKDSDTLPLRPDPLFNASPPKLSDPSGSNILGTEISLKLIRLLVGGPAAGSISGSAILDICQGCWMMTALKEREATTCTKALDEKLTDDVRRMDLDLEARLSVAGAALIAVQQMNAHERDAFIASCNQQRQHLQSLISWEFRKLLSTQQQILTSAGIPEFDGAATSSLSIYKQSAICSFLHSAFYLRNRIGEKAHVAMLKSQETKLATQQLTPMPMPQGMIQERMAPFVPQPQVFPQLGVFPPPPPILPPPPPYGQPMQYH